MLTKAYSSYTVVDVVDGLRWLGDFSEEPSNPQISDAYYNTQTKKSYIYDGEQWVVFASDGKPGAPGNGVSGVFMEYHLSPSCL